MTRTFRSDFVGSCWHEVFSVGYQGRKGLANGRLLAAAETEQLQVFVTADRNLRFQHSLVGRSLAVIVLSMTHWSDIAKAVETIRLAVDGAEVGTITSVTIPKSY